MRYQKTGIHCTGNEMMFTMDKKEEKPAGNIQRKYNAKQIYVIFLYYNLSLYPEFIDNNCRVFVKSCFVFFFKIKSKSIRLLPKLLSVICFTFIKKITISLKRHNTFFKADFLPNAV